MTKQAKNASQKSPLYNSQNDQFWQKASIAIWEKIHLWKVFENQF